MRKKALLAAALVVIAAGAAFAGGARNGGRDWRACHGGGWDRPACQRQWTDFRGPNAQDVPQEIREKWAEVQKTMIDLRMELSKKPVDRAKALALFEKRRSLTQEISEWHFKQKLDALDAK